MSNPIRAEKIIGSFTNVEDWHEVGTVNKPVFENSWGNYTATGNYNTAGFYKDPFGRVYIKGWVDAGSSATADIFTLPEDYRPPKDESMASISSAGVCRIRIKSTGEVNCVTGGSTNWISLDNISFRAD